MALPLSVIDFATVRKDQSLGESFADSVTLAQHAEKLGYSRVWYAEHHNMPTIASSAPAVLIAHVAAHTERIRLGSGGVMLPNHSPLTIAEQFGTLAELHPGRIDLGLGRAPGTDPRTLRALRRSPEAAENFPQDVKELQGYLRDESIIPGVRAVPGAGTNVPLTILGSSLFGAQLAAAYGLPYAFASHFAPDALVDAVAAYRSQFQPSEQLAEPYVIAAVNVIVSEDPQDAARQLEATQRGRVKAMVGRGREFTDEEMDMVMASPAASQVLHMLSYMGVGTPDTVVDYLHRFADHADADELMVSPLSTRQPDVLQSMELLARNWS
ncbi:LLM class flavin-dependent oxidoreductase [Kocuria rhizophila]|uniref:LLM class flavin-dependent oxidoreductase n=1 Tax=Kocuria rhizophila TaxID=72000 RepID=UPI0011AA1AF5|nr:LLM class flavin-dependent oxidoreductase [Kocuria rhizophila]MCT1917039.1 LLM class flavin-dependent oxidoreductase [Kocuria rhizophila]MDR7374264.1 luciferase family oxidoreductase group 1 [Kocuria rhizophila]